MKIESDNEETKQNDVQYTCISALSFNDATDIVNKKLYVFTKSCKIKGAGKTLKTKFLK